ncbi:HAD domain-like protein [Pseudomonas phage PaBG]|uniref:Uncharacterized protein n=1 Tax=Pseudomonas phage PaBG TaxID=1335230 RepID=S5VZI9_9CAUD|nr:HAD domain-like protein [Pseudomonas phage PaBG]AGS81975.1 HAD domain-like protein [Pseudomonas phage PaBG]
MIVFLDQDGVFVHPRSDLAGMVSDPVAVAVLNQLFALPRVRVVVSSTVRKGKSRERMQKHLQDRGILCTLHDDWSTGDHIDGRHNEIAAWLDRHDNPEDYLVLDDEHCAPPIDSSKWVKCDPANGMDVVALLRVAETIGWREHRHWALESKHKSET